MSKETKRRPVSRQALMLLEEMADRGQSGILAVAKGVLICRSLLRRGYAVAKAGYEKTYQITPEGRAYLKERKEKGK